MSKKIVAFDSTLRDGMQGEGIAFSVEDKLNIVHALDELGIDFIEAGNPGFDLRKSVGSACIESIKYHAGRKPGDD